MLTNALASPDAARVISTGVPATSIDLKLCGSLSSQLNPSTSGVRLNTRSISSCHRSGS
jgi:hypothetical protein